jgi:hypothetical protein
VVQQSGHGDIRSAAVPAADLAPAMSVGLLMLVQVVCIGKVDIAIGTVLLAEVALCPLRTAVSWR